MMALSCSKKLSALLTRIKSKNTDEKILPLEQKKKLHKKVFEELCNVIMPLEEY